MRQKKLLTGFALAGVCGLFTGIFSRHGCTVMPAGPVSNLFYAFGLISTGLLLWTVLFLTVTLFARNGLHASLLTLCLFVPALTAAPGSIGFRFWMLLPVTALSWVLRIQRHRTAARFLAAAAGAGAYLSDIRLIRGNIRAELACIVLLIVLCTLLYSAGLVSQREREPAVEFRFRNQI